MRDLNKFNQDDLRLKDDNYELIAEFMNLSDKEKMLMLDESIAALRDMTIKTPIEKRLISKMVNMRNILLWVNIAAYAYMIIKSDLRNFVEH